MEDPVTRDRPSDVDGRGDELFVSFTGRGPDLTLVHGFTQNSDCWGPFATDLARDHRLALVDAPGHGRSSALEVDLPTTGRLLADRLGASTYLGYSMGGRMVLHVALERPEVVDRLILVSTTAGIVDPAERAERRRQDERLADHLLAVGMDRFLDEWLSGPLFASLDEEGRALSARRRNTAAGLASSLRLVGTGTQEPLWDRLGDITAPTLVVVGAEDHRFRQLGEAIVDAIGEHAELAVIEGAGHNLTAERPAVAARTVRDWLRR